MFLDRIEGAPAKTAGGAGFARLRRMAGPNGTGKFLYAANSENNDIAIYSVSSNGALKFLKFTANTFGGFCSADVIRADPSGKFVYSLGMAKSRCTGGDALIGYTVNSTTGNLTPISGSPWANKHANGWLVITP